MLKRESPAKEKKSLKDFFPDLFIKYEITGEKATAKNNNQ